VACAEGETVAGLRSRIRHAVENKRACSTRQVT
jgi:hypothetical protein